jgi:hypothetical protein
VLHRVLHLPPHDVRPSLNGERCLNLSAGGRLRGGEPTVVVESKIGVGGARWRRGRRRLVGRRINGAVVAEPGIEVRVLIYRGRWQQRTPVTIEVVRGRGWEGAMCGGRG